jgi:DNA-binding MarR family transcriptional regulator
MSKSVEITAVAQEIVRVIPHIMRTIVAERYCSNRPISPAHFSLLTILANHSCNLSELAVQQAVSLPAMSNSISVLVERSWVKRIQSPERKLANFKSACYNLDRRHLSSVGRAAAS